MNINKTLSRYTYLLSIIILFYLSCFNLQVWCQENNLETEKQESIKTSEEEEISTDEIINDTIKELDLLTEKVDNLTGSYSNLPPEWANQYYEDAFRWNYISTIIMFFTVWLVIIVGLILSFMQFKTSMMINDKKKYSPENFKRFLNKNIFGEVSNSGNIISESLLSETFENEPDEKIVESKIKKNIHLDKENQPEASDKNLDIALNNPNNNGLATKTELRINRDGIELSSSVIGLITLVISLIFLWLYLYFVHPIRTIPINDINRNNMENKQ